MAESLDDGEFWLPPQFLDDEDEDENTAPFQSNGDDAAFHFGSFVCAPPSDLSSPLSGSSETESSDEDEHLYRVAEMTRRVARSTPHPDSKNPDKSTGGLVSGSPQSTLCGFGSGCCGCRKGSSQGSPSSVCNLCSSKATWDLLHAAAGEVERMRLSQQESGYAFTTTHHNGLFVPQRNHSPPVPTTTITTTNPDVGFYTQQQSLSHLQQLQIAQFQMLRQQQQQMAKQQQESVWGGEGVYQQRQSDQMVPIRGGRNARPLGLSPSAWPPLQHAKHQHQHQHQHQNKHHKHHHHHHLQQQQQQTQQYGSGLRAVFLGNPSGRRECAGTGVFLPRRADSPEPRKKPACSSVLVPARVVQALNLKLDDMVAGQPQHLPRFNASSNMEENAAIPRLRSNYGHSQQKRNIKHHPEVNSEIRLPQEWTY